MYLKIIPFLLLLTLISTSCEPKEPVITDRKPVTRTYESDGFRFIFSLQTEDGTVATVFKQGESVVSHFAVENLTGDTAYLTTSALDFKSNSTFGRVYRCDGTDMGRPHPCDIVIDMVVPFCVHLLPHRSFAGGINYPKDDDLGTLPFLPRGNYYVDFLPDFECFDTCMHAYTGLIPEHWPQQPTVIDIPSFTIQFKVL